MAFAKALKDDFVHARVAGLMAFMACIDCFEVEDLAGRVVGVVAGAVVDKEKYVAFRGCPMPYLVFSGASGSYATRHSKP